MRVGRFASEDESTDAPERGELPRSSQQPFTAEEKKAVAGNIYAHVWQAMNGEFASNKTIARDFPFVVEIVVPPNGLGNRLNAMHAFHNQRGIQMPHIRHRHEDDRDFIKWRFARRAIAEEFATEFGGSLAG